MSSKKRVPILKGGGVLDVQLIISVCFLLAFGFIMIYSASQATSMTHAMRSQVINAVIGLVLMYLVSRINYHWLVNGGLILYVLAVLCLTLVWSPLGQSSHGASRWISIGGITVQVAELVKPAIILLMAGLLDRNNRKLIKARYTFLALIPGMIALAAVDVITSNLSTAIIIGGITVIMLVIAYPNRKIIRWIIGMLILAAIAVFAYFHFVIQPEHINLMNQTLTEDSVPYRDRRLLAWLYPDEYPDWFLQTHYSLVAIASGGLLGRGLGGGIMKYRLPEPTNDFIFAVIGEELGFVGCAVVIFLLLYNIFQLVKIAVNAPDRAGCLVAGGVAAHISLQALLNIGVATSLIPNTGISLPFISYGGTALIVQLIEIGLALNVARQTPVRQKTVVRKDSKETKNPRFAVIR